MKNILLPTDFSENSWNAIKYALTFFKDLNCNFYLLHVNRLSNLITADSPYIPTQEIIENVYLKPAKKQLKEVLKRISKEFPDNKNHKFYTIAEYSFLIDSIRRYVEDRKIDFIVMGTKGASGLKERIMGSNTGDVVTKVKCSTIAVPEKAKYTEIKEIAFATDFDLSYGINTLQPILEILLNTKSSLRIVHIIKKGEELNSQQKQDRDFLKDIFNGSELNFHSLTNKKVEEAIQCFVESREIDLMVMVAKDLNYFQQILFHSKVEKISYHTNIPFLVLHE